ncbi:MAG: hypothetical protein AB8B55_11565 [Mariniblastus sp.]
MRPGISNLEQFNQSIFMGCWPWVACVIVAFMAVRILIAFSGAKMQLSKVRTVNRCEKGSVQSLSFVITLPFFLMIVMLIIQASQIIIANVVVHYAAFASVRSAVVWIPANVSYNETANRISEFYEPPLEPGEIRPNDGVFYRIRPSDEGKFRKIKQGAILALTSLGPSKNLGYQLSNYDSQTASALATMYKSLDSDASESNFITRRLRNKVAYVSANTELDLTFWHRYGPDPIHQDPPLQPPFPYNVPPYRYEYQRNELGWQDHITAQVTFNIPLLPGPARLLSPSARTGLGSATDQSGEVYIWPISGTATMGLEGEKPLRQYVQEGI